MRIYDPLRVRGYVTYELEDIYTGKITRGYGEGFKWYHRVLPQSFRDKLLPGLSSKIPFLKLGTENAILNTARNSLADFMVGTSVTSPNFVGIGTGSNTVALADTALQTPVDYDGSNEAKQSSSRTLLGRYTARIITQFTTSEANQSIRELGLFTAANSGDLWARVNVNITKTSTQRLTIYWYILFERRPSLAIKTGTSIVATGTLTSATISTATFTSAVTILSVENNSGGLLYLKLNGALVGSPPDTYDFLLADGESLRLLNEEISITTISCYKVSAGNITLPDNEVAIVGW